MKIKSYLLGKIKQMKKHKNEEYHGVSLLASHKQNFLNMFAYEYNKVGYIYGVYMWRIDLPKGYDTNNIVEILDLCGIRFTIDRDYTNIIDILYIFGDNRSFGILINGLRCGYYKQDVIFNRNLLEEFETYAGIYWITHDNCFDDFISLREIIKLNPSYSTRIEIELNNINNESAVNAFNKIAGVIVYNEDRALEYSVEYFSDQKIKNSIAYNSIIVEEENEKFDPSIDEII